MSAGNLLLGGSRGAAGPGLVRGVELRPDGLDLAALEGGHRQIAPARGGAMSMARPSGRRAYAVLVAPLRGVPEMLGLAPRSALVLISDPELRQRLPEVVLQDLHDLTPTQARVAAALARGESPEEIANALRTTVSTVRQHVKAILAKTDTHRQSDLVRLLLSSIAPLAAQPAPGARGGGAGGLPGQSWN